MRVAIYARVSKADKDDPNSIPVQLADCRDRAAEESWEVAGEFVDEGVSAWDPSRKRRRYEEMVEALGAGEFDVILVREQERLLRQMTDAVRLADLAEAGRLKRIACTMEGDLVLSRARDRKDFRDRASSAQFYSDFLGEKIRRTHARKRERGEWRGGGTRPFGYRVVTDMDRPPRRNGTRFKKLVVDEREAALIEKAAQDFLARRSTRGIAREWNEAGVKAPGGGLWIGTRVRDVLGSAHLAGLRDDGGPAGIPAILDEDVSQDVRDLIADPERKKYAASRTRRHYLVGTVRCASCGTKMTAHPNYHGTRTYLCRRGYDGTGCGATRIVADPLEEMVSDRLYARWEREPSESSQPETDREAVALLRELEERLQELARDYYGERILSREEYLAAKREVDARVAEVRERVRAVPEVALVPSWADIESAPETWAEAVRDPSRVEWFADLARRYIDGVLIHPAKRRGPVFEPERVEVIWRDGTRQRGTVLPDWRK